MGMIMRDGIPYGGNSGSSSDTNVTQIQSYDNADYEVLLGGSADELTHTESAKKSNKLKVNPSTGDVSMTGDIKLTGTGNTWDGKNTSIKSAFDGVQPTKTVTGNPVEFSDGADAPMVKCVTEIQGSQDLHGYDKPWVGGAGKNKTDQADVTMSAAGYVIGTGSTTEYINADHKVYPAGTYTVSFDLSDAAYPFNCQVALFDGSTNVSDSPTVRMESGGRKSITIIASTAFDKWKIYSASSSGGTFANFMIEEGSTATTYAPYSNICPITAYTEGEIEVEGKNFYQGTNSTQEMILYGGRDSGTVVVSEDWTLNPGTYYVSFDFNNVPTTMPNLYFASKVNNVWSQRSLGQIKGFSMTIPENCEDWEIWYYGGSNVGGFKDVQIERGTQKTDYVPYDPDGKTHTTAFPSAIYRGSEDVVNGTETHDVIKVVFDGSEDEGWIVSSDRFRVTISDSSLGSSTVNLICNLYEGKTANNVYANRLTAGYIGIAANDDSIIVVDNVNFANKDLSAFKAFLANNPLEIAYELATPTISPVTPTNLPIKSLSGYNHIESTTGDMEVEYITEWYQPLVDMSDKVKQTNYYSSSQTGEVFTLPFSKDNTADTTTSSLYKNKGVEVHIGSGTTTGIMTMDSGCSYNETLNYSFMSNGGVTVGARQTLSDPMEYMSISDSDIYCTQTWDGTNASLKQAIADLTNPGLANGILYSFSAIGNALQLGQITGTIFGYIDILTHVTSSTVGDTHEAYLFSLNVDEFISASGTTPGTEYPVESVQLIHTGQASGLVFVAYYDQSNNIYLKPVIMPGYEQTIKHISLYLSNPHVITV